MKKLPPYSPFPVLQWPLGEGLKAISLFKNQGVGPGENQPRDPGLPQATGSARFNNIVLFLLSCFYRNLCLAQTIVSPLWQ